MKRRTSTEPVGIWTAFALAPAEGADIVRKELHKAHDYYNRLVQIRLERLANFRVARGAVGAALPALEAELQALSDKITEQVNIIRAARGAARKRVENPVVSACIKALKEERKALKVRVLAARNEAQRGYAPGNKEMARRSAELAGGSRAPRTKETTNRQALEEMLTDPTWPEEWKVVARNDAAANEAGKKALAQCGLTPGTYLLVQKSVDAAFAPPAKGQPPRPDPRPKDRFIGEGRLGVQVNRLPVTDLLAGRNNQIALRMSTVLPKGRNAQQRYGTLRMRVTQDNQYVEFPIKLHRSLPADGVITQIWVRAERHGPRTRYALQCVVETSQWVKPGAVEGAGTVAIDTGWRVMDGGIRVAYWMDDHGRHGQILVPEGVRKAVAFADSLRGAADTHFNAACAEVRNWMAANPNDVPAWMAEDTETIAHWRAHWRLIRVAQRLAYGLGPLWQQWRIERKAAGSDLLDSFAEVSNWLQQKQGGSAPPLMQAAVYLEWWRRKDAHLYDWEMRERRHADNARTEMFRKVCQVARQYEHVMVENIDLPKFAKNASPEEKANQEWLHRTARIASPGDLAARIMEACKGRATKVPPGANTRTCHKCQHVNNAWEHPERRVQMCAGCGAEWDRDENACRIMLALWHSPDGERSGDAPDPASARGPENAPDGSAEGLDWPPDRAPEAVRNRDRSQSGRQDAGMTAGPG